MMLNFIFGMVLGALFATVGTVSVLRSPQVRIPAMPTASAKSVEAARPVAPRPATNQDNQREVLILMFDSRELAGVVDDLLSRNALVGQPNPVQSFRAQ
jgi:hypothetical protein